MIVIDPPPFVDCMVATMATSPTGEVAAVIVARAIAQHDALPQYMLICDALAGSFSDFDGFCENLFDRVDELAGTIRSRANPVVFCDADVYERVGRHARIDLSASGHGHLFKPPVNCGHVNCAYYPPRAEQDPARRATLLAAAVRVSSAMAKKILQHPYDALASARFDPASPNPLADALGRAFDVVMVTNTERRKAQHRRGEL